MEKVLGSNALRIAQDRYFDVINNHEQVDKLVEKKEREGLTVEEEAFIIESKETWKDLVDRVSTAVAQPEEDQEYWQERFAEMLNTRIALPNSPTLMNASTELAQLSACYVLIPDDSMEDIYDTAKEQALIQKSGGGTGFGLSRLRSMGSKISTTRNGTSSGVLSWIEIFNTSTEMIQQGGIRRGANMGTLHVWHGDILDFITAKSKLSVKNKRVVDMAVSLNPDMTGESRLALEKALINGQLTNFNLSVIIDRSFIQAVTNDGEWKLYNPKVVNGKVARGEYLRTVPAREIWDVLVRNAHTNGDPGVLFDENLEKGNPMLNVSYEATNPCLVGDTLVKTVEGDFPIKDLVGKEVDVFCADENNKLTIAKAKDIRMTRKNAELVEVETYKGSITCTPDHRIMTKNRGWVEAQDLKKGDKILGFNKKMKNERQCSVSLSGGEYVPEHRFILGHYKDIEGKDVHHRDDNPLNNVLSNLEVLEHGEHSIVSNEGHEDWSIRNEDGTFSSKDELKKKRSYRLDKPVGVNWFVKSVTKLDYSEDVYDLEVPEYHNFVANNMVVHNCGEQPLDDDESCNLGSIDLAKHRKSNGVDWDMLESTIEVMVRFLDNVIDINKFPLKTVEEATKNTRKIGLGVMGWSRLLQYLKIPYDSQEAVALAEKLSLFIQKVGHNYSREIALEKGAFPGIADSKHIEPIRNATVTTIAPTGTISLLAETSGGIEPDFLLGYKRVVNGNTENEFEMYMKNEALEHFLEERDMNTLEVWDMIIDNGGSIQGLEILEDLEDVFVTSHEIAPEYHLKHQIAWQKGVDNAISKTINLTSDASIKDVEDIYMKALHGGLKGVTVYRDGSRIGQTLQNFKEEKEKEKEEFKQELTFGILEEADDVCPQCGGKIIQKDGCSSCVSCGFGACSI